MKYKLININTKEEHLCDKVTIDGFDYYLGKPVNKDGENLNQLEFYIEHTQINPDKFSLYKKEIDDDSFENSFTIVATTNPNINIPKVVDEVEILHKDAYVKHSVKDDKLSFDEQIQRSGGFIVGYKEGYNKSQETHPFSEEDIRFMLSEAFKASQEGYQITTDEIIQIWKEQQPKILYYEN